MKKNIWGSLIFILSVAMVLLAYLFLFLFPALIDINRCRREIKNIQLKTNDQNSTKQTIVGIDRRERRMLKKAKRDLWNRIPRIESREAKKELIQNIVDQIKKSADAEGIRNFRIESGSPDMEISKPNTSLSESEIKLFSRLVEDAEKERRNGIFHSGLFFEDLSRKVVSQKICLGFSGELSQATSLIYALSQSDVYTELENIRISAGLQYPFFFVILRCYFQGEEKEATIQEKPDENQIQKKKTSQDMVTGEDFIDLNSPLLLFPVYRTWPCPGGKKELPKFSSGKIFKLGRR